MRPTSLSMLFTFTFPTIVDAHAFTRDVESELYLRAHSRTALRVLIETSNSQKRILKIATKHGGLQDVADLLPDRQPRTAKPQREYSPRGLPLHAVPPAMLWQCQDCFRRADDYMVHNQVWRDAFETCPGASRAPGALCFECLEHRLKRPLTIDDFQRDVPINRGIFLGASLTKTEP